MTSAVQSLSPLDVARRLPRRAGAAVNVSTSPASGSPLKRRRACAALAGIAFAGATGSTGAAGADSFPDKPDVTPEVTRVIVALQGEMSRQDLRAALDLKDAKHFREAYLQPALAAVAVEMTLPDAPRSSKQRYRLTAAGERARARLRGGA